ncbi:hypothetical protein C362_03239 [Cryptococcus neoformans Bt1]|nr:hypothetical protein C362_03239 [Cryptococcus neoformans var. grubii Bt1]
MEFHTSSQEINKPKQLYPCLAVIDINSSDTKSRRLSAGSFGSDKDEGNVLTRVISGGGRRKSSFGETGGGGGGRRLSFGGKKDDDKVEGKWYWRVQAGVNETHIVLLPLTQPPNPLLTTRPAPLSAAIPSRATHEASTHPNESAIAENEGGNEPGFASRMKNMFRRASSSVKERPSAPSASETTSGGPSIGGERVTDQTERGEMLPSVKGNVEGATNLNSNAELGWPGMINGEKLGAILIPLSSIGKKVGLGGGKKADASWVTVQVTSNTQSMEPIGTSRFDPGPKSGSIKFEFDKDWLGARGEAEVLHHYITTAAAAAPAPTERTAPNPSSFQLGGQHATSEPTQQAQTSDPLFSGSPFANTGRAGDPADRPLVDEAIAPDVSATSSRKVAGVY